MAKAAPSASKKAKSSTTESKTAGKKSSDSSSPVKASTSAPVETGAASAAAQKKLNLLIVHRGGWCKQRSSVVRKYVAEKLAPKTQVELTEKVEAGSGKFEVFVDGKIRHSMKGGDGHLSNYPEKLNKLVAALKSEGY